MMERGKNVPKTVLAPSGTRLRIAIDGLRKPTGQKQQTECEDGSQ